MMKNLFLLLFVSFGLIAGCNNKKNASGSNEATTADPATPAQQQKEEMLQGLTAHTPQEVEIRLPAELIAAPVSDKSSGKENGAAYARAIYAPNDTVAVQVTLFDCGGSEGAGFYRYQFLDKVNSMQTETPSAISSFNGDKAIEEYNEDSYRSSFTYTSGRYMIILESESLDIAGLKKIAGGWRLE